MLDEINSRLLLNQLGAARSTPLMVKDRDHRFVYVNEAFAGTVGRPVVELLGRNDLELGRPERLVLGDPSTGWPGLWELDDQVWNSGIASSHTDAGFNPRSSTLTERRPLLNDAGEVVGLLVQLRDLSEIHGLERTAENSRDALWLQQGETTTLDLVLASLSSCHDTITLLRQLVNTIVERTSADGAYIAQVHESRDFMEFVAVAGLESERFAGSRRQHEEGLIGKVWSRGEAAFVNDLGDTHSEFEWAPQTQAFAIPLIVDGITVAVVSIVSGPTSSDLAKDIPILERIARIATFGITNTLLMDATAKTLSKIQAMEKLSRLLNTVENAIDACHAVCRVLLPAFDAVRTSSYLIDEFGGLKCLASWSVDNGVVHQADTLPDDLIGSSIVQWCVNHSQMAVIVRDENDPRESAALHAVRERLNIGSTCCVPMYKGGVISGALLIARDREQLDFNQNDTDAFTSAVNQLSTSLERHELASELQHQVFHDRLTTLPNRHRFELELDEAISEAQASKTTVTVLFIDLDGFKNINDTLGHAAGDLLLSLVSDRLRGCIKSTDVLARMGGDEFAVIIREEDSADAAYGIAQRLLSSLATPFSIVGECASVGASIGVSAYPEDGLTGDDILRCADTAMYQAKHSGKGQVLCFDKTLAEDARDRSKLESELRQAIDREEFKLLYQPQVRCSDNQVIGVEALIRWHHPIRGVVSPLEFIPLAESVGLIDAIGAWVIDEAVRQLAVWQETTLSELRVSINIAASQFQLEDFTDQVLNALDRHKVPPSLLELEVTESVVMNDVASVVQRLYRLREAGVRVAIDDFGTGYSSLSYLQDLPLDVLKIDRSFVTRLANQTGEQSLVKTIQLLASGLGLETVAEGVESLEQKDAVEELGCDLIQGYLHSRPVEAGQIPDAVSDIQSRHRQDSDGYRAA